DPGSWIWAWGHSRAGRDETSGAAGEAVGSLEPQWQGRSSLGAGDCNERGRKYERDTRGRDSPNREIVCIAAQAAIGNIIAPVDLPPAVAARHITPPAKDSAHNPAPLFTVPAIVNEPPSTRRQPCVKEATLSSFLPFDGGAILLTGACRMP